MKLMFIPAFTSARPCVPVPGDLWDVRVDSANTVWVAGYDFRGPIEGYVSYWDGTEWVEKHEASGGTQQARRLSRADDDTFWVTDRAVYEWDGSAWNFLADILTPNAGNSSLTALTASDIYYAGDSSRGSALNYSHYNGSTWSLSNNGHIDAVHDRFVFDLCHDELGNVWACGSVVEGPVGSPVQHSFIELVTFPGTQYVLTLAHRMARIWALAHNNVYASDSLGQLWHYNGSGWALLSTCPRAFAYEGGHGVDNDIWICGTQGGTGYLYAEHFDGSTWTPHVVSPFAGTLWGIYRRGANDVWVCGNKANKLFMAHYNGTSWADISPCDTYYPAFGLGYTLDLDGSCTATFTGLINYNNIDSIGYPITYHYEVAYDLDSDGIYESLQITSPTLTTTIPPGTGTLPADGPFGPTLYAVSGCDFCYSAQLTLFVEFADLHTAQDNQYDYAPSCP